jgi:hypothetical protein
VILSGAVANLGLNQRQTAMMSMLTYTALP